jgi:hypothetical protein
MLLSKRTSLSAAKRIVSIAGCSKGLHDRITPH